MKEKQLLEQVGSRSFVLVFDVGDEVLRTLRE